MPAVQICKSGREPHDHRPVRIHQHKAIHFETHLMRNIPSLAYGDHCQSCLFEAHNFELRSKSATDRILGVYHATTSPPCPSPQLGPISHNARYQDTQYLSQCISTYHPPDPPNIIRIQQVSTLGTTHRCFPFPSYSRYSP
jgi:hypothetical protein